MSNADLLLVNGVVVAGAARAGWGRFRGSGGIAPRRTLAQRRQVNYPTDAAFIASLGLDPAQVLGPPPDERATFS